VTSSISSNHTFSNLFLQLGHFVRLFILGAAAAERATALIRHQIIPLFIDSWRMGQLSSTSLGSAGCNLNRFGSLSSQLSADRKRPEDSWKRSSELICIQSNAFLLFFSQMIHNSVIFKFLIRCAVHLANHFLLFLLKQIPN
jgi:hypothetical protein